MVDTGKNYLIVKSNQSKPKKKHIPIYIFRFYKFFNVILLKSFVCLAVYISFKDNFVKKIVKKNFIVHKSKISFKF